MKKKILFRVDGGQIPEIGMGHLTRCLTLARELSAHAGTEILFLTRGDTEGAAILESQGHRVWRIDSLADEDRMTMQCLVDFNPDILVVDSLHVRSDFMALVKKTGVILIALDYTGEGRRHADFTINPILQDQNGLYAGYDYMVLPSLPHQKPAAHRNAEQGMRDVFVSFGGFDRHDMTQRFLHSISDAPAGHRFHVVVGQTYQGDTAKWNNNQPGSNVRLYKNPANYSDLLHQADLAVVSGGLTMFQAAASGVPSLVVSQYPHQQENAVRLQKSGAVEYVGSVDSVNFGDVLRRVGTLSADEPLRQQMSISGRRLLDGRGNSRVASLIGIIDRLDWDSDFFNLNIAYLYPKRLRENIAQFAMKKCEEDRIDCVYYLCDCNDPESVRLAEKFGFHFVDIRLTFSQDVRRRVARRPPVGPKLTLRPAVLADGPGLGAIAAESYIHSRYFFDHHFPEEVCRKFYADWITKSIEGKFDHAVLVAEQEGHVAGYVSCRHVSANYGAIGLVGIAAGKQGQGIGTQLIGAALDWFAERDIPFVHVVTQGRNLPAQRLYQSCGFRSEKLELWYHKWFRERYAH